MERARPRPSKQRQIRLLGGVTLRELANASGVCMPSLSEWERGLVRLSPEQKARVRDALGCLVNR